MILKLPYYYSMAKYRVWRKAWPSAAQNYQHLVGIVPGRQPWQYKLIELLIKSKRFREALSVAEKGLSKHPSDETLQALKLLSLRRLNDTKGALDYIKKLLKSGELPVVIQASYADVLFKAGKQSEARDEYEKLLELATAVHDEKNVAEAAYWLGWICGLDSDESGARSHYEQAVRTSPSDNARRFGVGFLHRKHRNFDEAIKAYKEQAAQDPDDKELWFEIGNTYMKLLDKESAAEAYAEFVRLDQEQGAYSLDAKRVVFDAYNGRNYTCSPRAIYETMLKDERFKDFRFVWVLRSSSLTRYWRLYLNPRTKVVKYRSIDYFREYGQAKYWIVNSRLQLVRRLHDEQVYVQCWHGTPLKKLGHSLSGSGGGTTKKTSLHTPSDEDTRRFSYLVSPSKRASEFFTEAFALDRLGMTDRIIETGYPRNDRLARPDEKDALRIRSKLNLSKDRKLLLYAPTWRDDQYDANKGHLSNVSTIEKTFDYLKKELSDEWTILFRAHYMVAKDFQFSKYGGFIRDVSGVDDVNDLYIASDALMTDYSSVFFDYANLGRPMIFYMYDLEHYRDELRGFYVDVEKELPGDIVKTEQEIVSILQDLTPYNERHASKYREFQGTYTYLDDGNAAQRVIETTIASGAKK